VVTTETRVVVIVQQALSTHMRETGEKLYPTGQLPVGDGNARHRVVADGAQVPLVGLLVYP
jgi:hypothetical protein